jgi:hypothetical protein
MRCKIFLHLAAFLFNVRCRNITNTHLLQGFGGGNMRERDHLGDPGVDGRIILRWIFRKWGIDWIGLAQGRDRWQALVNTVMNFRAP